MTATSPSAAFWDKIAPKYLKSPISDMAGYEDSLARTQSYFKPTDHVLEIGCGTGMTALRHAPHVARMVATDVSSAMINLARAREGQRDNLAFEQAAADAPPQGPFDVVLALNLLHLVPSVPRVLAAAYDRLKPGGTFISKSACLGDGGWYLRPMIGAMKLVGKAPDVTYFTAPQLSRSLHDAGFDLIETRTTGKRVPVVFIVAKKPALQG